VFESEGMMRNSGNRCSGEVRPLQCDDVEWFWGPRYAGRLKRRSDLPSLFAMGNDSAHAEEQKSIVL
jgi:hypothetical protein